MKEITTALELIEFLESSPPLDSSAISSYYDKNSSGEWVHNPSGFYFTWLGFRREVLQFKLSEAMKVDAVLELYEVFFLSWIIEAIASFQYQPEEPDEVFHQYALHGFVKSRVDRQVGLDSIRKTINLYDNRLEKVFNAIDGFQKNNLPKQEEHEPTPKQIEKLRYLHLSGMLPHLIEEHKRISGRTSVNWDAIAHVVHKMTGEPFKSIRKPIREHYTGLNDRLENFKEKEEVLGVLKSKQVREID